jgi:alpha-glucoside transport system permease protein
MRADSHMVLASTFSDSIGKLWGVIEAVGGFAAIMLIIFFVAGRVTGRLQKPLAIVICLGPALLLVLVALVIPAIQTFVTSLHNTQLINTKGDYVGFRNYGFAFSDSTTRAILIRTIEWIIVVPLVSTAVGLVVAILVERIRFQSTAKSLIFLPTAISFVGAAVIWQYVYNYVDPKQPQTGLLSEIAIKLGWKNPPNWLLDPPLNTFLLMAIMIWIQAGFAMVVLSAALNSIPDEIVEAARMDGATGFKLFRTVQVPMIRATLIVVITTVMIATLKVFDIVYTITDGNYNTDILSSRMYSQIFVEQQAGKGSALAVLLFLVVLPLVIYNILRMRKERAIR